MESVKYQCADFAQEESTLSKVFRSAMQAKRWDKFCWLNHDAHSVTMESYKSKSAAKTAVRCVVDDAHSKANRFFKPGTADCLASETAKKYSRHLHQRVTPLLDMLDAVCADDSKKKEKLVKLREKITGAEKYLRAQFEDDLRENEEFYRLYEKSYFVDKVDIEELDADDGLGVVMGWLFRNTEYMTDGLLEVMSEIQEDMNSHAQMFFSTAYDTYRYFCREIAELADEIGNGIRDEVLIQAGILKEASCGDGK